MRDPRARTHSAPLAKDAPRAGDGNDWLPCAAPETMRHRAAMLERIRAFFAAAGVLEVETPILSRRGVTDPALESLSLMCPAPGQGSIGEHRLYLQTSPEAPMKRLLAAGSGPIYQICKVFRGGERGRFHHPEFTMLEWYRPGWDYGRLMEEVADLVRVVLQRPAMPMERLRYLDLYLDRLGLDPLEAAPQSLRAVAADIGMPDADRLELERDAWLDLLLALSLEPRLGRGCLSFVYDYPPSQAAMARIQRADEDHVGAAFAQRFELYIEGLELANGFQELTDAAEQGARFVRDLAERHRRDLAATPPDERLIAALGSGMPSASGVAIGLDRLLMIATGAGHIDEVLAFPLERA